MSIFEDRIDAGYRLAVKLEEIIEEEDREKCIILGIPRGGVETAYPVAQKLGRPLDVIVPRKIGAPGNPEMAVGAVTQDGTLLWDESLIIKLNISLDEMEPIIRKELREVKKRTEIYRRNNPPLELKDSFVVLIDDGITTGFTLEAALKSIEKQAPSKVLLAVPVGSYHTVIYFSKKIETLCLHAPQDFKSVALYYEKYNDITHELVTKYLTGSR